MCYILGLHLKLPTHRVHLKVDNLSTSERNHHLSMVDSASHYGLLAWGLPLVNTPVRPDVADAIGVDLTVGHQQQSIPSNH